VIRDGTRVPVPRTVVGRTISPGTAQELTTMMEAVVDRGTATRAQVAGYTIAGKTGTASKVVDGRYSRSDYNVSFVGFVPSRKPLFTIIVVVDSPHAVSPYGGIVAAPIFQRIADAALRHRGVPPSLNAAPPLLVARRDDTPERPAAGPAELPAIVTLAGATHGAGAVFPDLRGLSARDALRALARLGLNAQMNGVGVVVAQHPEAGTLLERGMSGTLWLGRSPALP
jgi:membrane peptidoglycan carboxypeptidase